MGFISRPLESKHIIAEFNTAKVDYIIIIDSNVSSETFLFPISGNDDSAICLNFYSYLFALIILSFKIRNVVKFERWVYKKYKKKPLGLNNKLLNLYLYKNTNMFSTILNNNILKSYISFINNSYRNFN
jgi:ribosomal protein S2